MDESELKYMKISASLHASLMPLFSQMFEGEISGFIFYCEKKYFACCLVVFTRKPASHRD